MRTISRILIILVLLLLITIASSYIYIRSNYVIEPITKLIQEQTGYVVKIDSVEYNPLFPDTILFKHVSIDDAFEADQIYAEFDSTKLIDSQLDISDLEVINSKINLEKLPQLKGSNKLFKDIKIKDLHLKDFSIKHRDWSIDDSIIEISNLDIVKNSKYNQPKNFFVNMFANRFKFNDIIFHSFNSTFHYSEDKITVDEIRTNYRDGNLLAQLEIYPILEQVIIKKLSINQISSITDFSAIRPFLQWQYDIYDANVLNCDIDLPDLEMSIHGLNLIVNDLTWKESEIKHLSIIADIDKYTYQNLQLEKANASISLPLSNPVSHILLSGQYSGGNVEAYIKYDKRTDFLDIHEISAKGVRLLNPDFSAISFLLDSIPFNKINFRVVNIQDLYYDSMDESNPLLIKDINIFLNHISYHNDEIKAMGKKAHIELSANEIAIPNVDTKDLNCDMLLDNNGLVTINSIQAQINQGKVNASGILDPNAKALNLTITGNGVDFAYANLLLEGHQTVGSSNFEVNLQKKPQQDDMDFAGKLILKDVLITNMDIELMDNAKGQNLKTNWIQSLSSPKSLIIGDSSIEFSKKAEVYSIKGEMDAISKFYKLDAEFHWPAISGDKFMVDILPKISKDK